MNDFTSWMLWELGRASLYVAMAAVAMLLLLRLVRVHSPGLHRLSWCVALLVGWTLYGLAIEVPWEQPFSRPLASAAQPTKMRSMRNVSTSGDSTLIEQRIAYLPEATGDAARLAPSIDAGTSSAWWSIAHWPDFSWPLAALGVWGLGMGVLGLGWLVGYLRFVRRLPGEVDCDPQWRDEWHAMLAQNGRGDWVRLRVTEQSGPMLCRLPSGYELLVPAVLWESLGPEERSAILRHELAHWHRGDVWKSLGVRLLALPHWFNPLAWLAVRRFDEAAEWACDEAAGGDQPTVYAAALVRLGELANSQLLLSSAGRARPLAARIRRVVTTQGAKDPAHKRASLLLAAACLLLVAMVRVHLVDPAVASSRSATTLPPAASDPEQTDVRAVEGRSGNDSALGSWEIPTTAPDMTGFSLDELCVVLETELDSTWSNAASQAMQPLLGDKEFRQQARDALRAYAMWRFSRLQRTQFNRNANPTVRPGAMIETPWDALPRITPEQLAELRYRGWSFIQWHDLLLNSNDLPRQQEALQALSAFADLGYTIPAVETLLEMVRDRALVSEENTRPDELVRRALLTFQRMAKIDIVEPLLAGLVQGNANQRLFVLAVLPMMGMRLQTWTPQFFTALADEDPRVRQVARQLAALSMSESPALANAFRQALVEESPPHIASTLALVAGKTQPLVGLTESEATNAAMPALAGDVAKLLGHADDEVRSAASDTLYRLGDAALEPLETVAASDDPVASPLARQTLQKISDNPPPALSQSWGLRIVYPQKL